MTLYQAKAVSLEILDRMEPVMFSEYFLAMTGQTYRTGDLICYDGKMFRVEEVHHATQLVETRRVRK